MTIKIKITNNSQCTQSNIIESLNTCSQVLWQETVVIDEEENQYHLILDSTLPIKFDGYLIELNQEKKYEIKASEYGGLLYGLLAIYQEKVELGKVTAPIFSERGLMVDAGRKFFSFEWFMDLLPRLYQLRINRLQLHFSDNEGFRIESVKHPEIVSDEHLTKKQVREILQYAKLLGIEVIPEFDSPGHLKQILQNYPQYQMIAIENEKEVRLPQALNITDTKAVKWLEELMEEYFELFRGCRYFHLGADEFIDFNHLEKYPEMIEMARQKYGETACGLEPYIDYTNNMIQKVKRYGFIPRVWNDGFYRKNLNCKNQLDKEVEITYWTRWDSNMAPVSEYLDRGYHLINFNDNFFYYVLGEAAGYSYPTVGKIKTGWTLIDFPQQQKITVKEMDQVGGCYLAVWSDVGEAQTEKEVKKAILPLLETISKKIW